jgi:8-oxo-dGTP pyrophosphatase MutT (NUDIX family)
MTIGPWDRIERRQAYAGRIFTIYRERLRSPVTGGEHPFDIVETPDWVNVVALTAENRVLLIRQYRAGTRSVTTEIPGGTVDEGETPLAAARRELEEETGYTSDDWAEIGSVEPNPAFQTNTTYTFLARDARRTGRQRFDETEAIEVAEHPLADIPRLITRGVITHALVVCAFFHAFAKGLLPAGPGPSTGQG